jgi:hypothetical protein
MHAGTGSSLGTPVASHLMNTDLTDPRTLPSRLAAIGDPRDNRNYRCNPSLMVRYRSAAAADGCAGTTTGTGPEYVEKNIVVDVGR